jgi:hypothetical protein
MSEEQGTPTEEQASGASYSLPLNENERGVVTLALQELLGTVTRSEHLTGTIEPLLARLKALQPNE